jgi:hypothetical protein
MASRADIANLALLKLGSGTKITSLTDNSPAAATLNRCYDMMRQAELRANYWSFALRRTTVPKLAAVPPWGFKQQFGLPDDYLRLQQVNDFYIVPALSSYTDYDASAYAIETNSDGVLCILTDYPAPLKLRYVRDVQDEGLFDALFTVSFAIRLAFECCEQITNSNSKKAQLKEDYKDAIKLAARTSAIEKPPQAIGDDSWMVARL